ncbi:MAG: hypothetical protein KJ592_02300 [Nanoarchaeota archaeon]|nr:hypothetical protein [Nanoarchaeota archaeon]
MGVEVLVEKGMMFTGVAERKSGKDDLVVRSISGHNGYVKENLNNDIEVYPGVYYRFKVVAGPYCKRMHNFYYVVAKRGLFEDEGVDLNVSYSSLRGR